MIAGLDDNDELVTCVIDAEERRDIAVIDVPNTFI